MDIFKNFTGHQQVMTLTVNPPPQTQLVPPPQPQPVPVTNQVRLNTVKQHNNNQVLPSNSNSGHPAPIPFQTSDPEAMRYIGILTAQTQELKRRLDQADKIAPKKLKESQRKDGGEGEYDDPDYASEDNWVIIKDQGGQLCKDDGLKRLELMSLRTKLRPPNADPSSWGWGTFECRLSLPRRATTLNLEHIQVNLCNPYH